MCKIEETGVCNIRNVFLKEETCPSFPLFLLPVGWNVDVMAGPGAAV